MNLSKLILGLALPALTAPAAFAHCDTLDGPVVDSARRALAAGDVKLVLAWVQEAGEAEVREAFQRAVAVRGLGGEARRLADQFFFETLVRVHRTGEGAPFTGLKPAGQDLGPAVPLGDKALATGDLKPVERLLDETAAQRLHHTFTAAMAAKSHAPNDLVAGRRYVQAYITYIHTVEAMYQAAAGAGHRTEAAEPDGHGAASHAD